MIAELRAEDVVEHSPGSLTSSSKIAGCNWSNSKLFLCSRLVISPLPASWGCECCGKCDLTCVVCHSFLTASLCSPSQSRRDRAASSTWDFSLEHPPGPCCLHGNRSGSALPLGSSPSAVLTSESKGSLGRSHQVTLQHNGPTQQLCALIYAPIAICWTGQSPSLHTRRNRQLHSPLHSRPAKERGNKNKEAVMPSCPFLECPWGGGEEYIEVKSYLIPVLRQLEEDGCISCLQLARADTACLGWTLHRKQKTV